MSGSLFTATAISRRRFAALRPRRSRSQRLAPVPKAAEDRNDMAGCKRSTQPARLEKAPRVRGYKAGEKVENLLVPVSGDVVGNDLAGADDGLNDQLLLQQPVNCASVSGLAQKRHTNTNEECACSNRSL